MKVRVKTDKSFLEDDIEEEAVEQQSANNTTTEQPFAAQSEAGVS